MAMSQLEIPACEARAVALKAGQVITVISHEGPQVGDLFVATPPPNSRTLSSHATCGLNGRSLTRADTLFGGPPDFPPLLEVVADPTGRHWIHGRCTSPFYARHQDTQPDTNCHTNILNALAAYGFGPTDVPLDTFNIFMAVEIDQDGHYGFSRPSGAKGSAMTFRAAEDVVVAVSACPADDVVNDFSPKAMLLEYGDDV